MYMIHLLLSRKNYAIIPRKIAQDMPDLYKKLVGKQTGINFDAAWDRYFWVLQLFDFFNKYVHFKNMKVLDVGSGMGKAALALKKRCKKCCGS